MTISESYTMNLEPFSITNVCKGSNQAMIYGWRGCDYLDIAEALNAPGSPLQKAFNYKIGVHKLNENEEDCKKRLYTCEGRKIEQITLSLEDIPGENSTDETVLNNRDNVRKRRECKAALVNIVLENYKRSLEKLPPIKILFIAERANSKYAADPVAISSKEASLNGRVTHKELRRCYKLVHYSQNPDIAQIAKETIQFVKLNEANGSFTLSAIDPYWEKPEWKPAWEARLANPGTTPAKATPWRQELEMRAVSFKKMLETKK